MRLAYLSGRISDRAPPLSRRAIGGLLAIAIEALIIALLILSSRRAFVFAPQQGALKTFTVGSKPEPVAASEAEKKQKRTVTKPKTAPPPPATKPPVPPTPLGPIPGLITLSREDYARSDIGKIKSTADEVANKGDEAKGDADDSVAIGSAPNGQPLYPAQWYREPTDAELAFYIPKGLRSGAALIACKTAPRYRVEDCVVLGDAPPGTGLARGIREAAWQFRVRPPRKGGQDLIGAWVQIRFDLIERGR